MLKEYYTLTKPGIIRGNILTTLAGFLFASKTNVSWDLLFYTLVGTSLVIAAGCVYNNVIDRNIDKKMARTKQRALPKATISIRSALLYATLLGYTGFVVLYTFTNMVTVLVGLTGLIFYVILYGYVKRRSVFATEVGTVAGATPILAGYTAVTGSIGSAGILLFVIMVVWQMPHFYAIAIFRKKEYAKANIPVISVQKGVPTNKKRIVFFIVLYGLVALTPAIAGYASVSYGVIMLSVSLYWLYIALKTYKTLGDIAWARKNFGLSLIALLVFSLALSINTFLP